MVLSFSNSRGPSWSRPAERAGLQNKDRKRSAELLTMGATKYLNLSALFSLVINGSLAKMAAPCSRSDGEAVGSQLILLKHLQTA
jgi:hypothetical protein